MARKDHKILVIDDEPEITDIIKSFLTNAGYDVLVENSSVLGIEKAKSFRPDLILLDIMMPKMDGYQFLRQYRQERQTPIIIITAREEETDAVLGLELGADDYVVKPFRMRELVARIQAVLRRNQDSTEKFEVYRQGEILVDERTHTVTVKEQPVSLTPIEFALLAIFMRSPGRVFSRSELVDLLSESNFTGLDSTLNVHVRNLRLKIEPDPANPLYIETVFGIGYRFQKIP